MTDADTPMSKTVKTFYESELERIYCELLPAPEQFARVRQSKAFMEEHYPDKIVLNDLAKAAFMSRFHYLRMFRRMYGLTPRAYLRDLRIRKAKDLIRTGLSVTQVCFDTGYDSVSTFSAAFKKCTGHTPREYRRMHNSNPE